MEMLNRFKSPVQSILQFAQSVESRAVLGNTTLKQAFYSLATHLLYPFGWVSHTSKSFSLLWIVLKQILLTALGVQILLRLCVLRKILEKFSPFKHQITSKIKAEKTPWETKMQSVCLRTSFNSSVGLAAKQVVRKMEPVRLSSSMAWHSSDAQHRKYFGNLCDCLSSIFPKHRCYFNGSVCFSICLFYVSSILWVLAKWSLFFINKCSPNWKVIGVPCEKKYDFYACKKRDEDLLVVHNRKASLNVIYF